MKVTYICHSSFLVELEGAVLLFDYYKGEIPAIDKDKPLIVLASHKHGDHYSPVIFQLLEKHPKTVYVLSSDIDVKKLSEHVQNHIITMKDGERIWLDLHTLSASETGEGTYRLEIETFQSTDEGVAFWLRYGEKEIYHGGDLNNWWWEGETKAWNHNISANYKREIGKMAGRTADVAFVPLDPRQEQWFYLGMDQFMEKVNVKAIFPMHFWGDYSIIDKMKELPASASYRDKIIKINKEGEVFNL